MVSLAASRAIPGATCHRCVRDRLRLTKHPNDVFLGERHLRCLTIEWSTAILIGGSSAKRASQSAAESGSIATPACFADSVTAATASLPASSGSIGRLLSSRVFLARRNCSAPYVDAMLM